MPRDVIVNLLGLARFEELTVQKKLMKETRSGESLKPIPKFESLVIQISILIEENRIAEAWEIAKSNNMIEYLVSTHPNIISTLWT